MTAKEQLLAKYPGIEKRSTFDPDASEEAYFWGMKQEDAAWRLIDSAERQEKEAKATEGGRDTKKSPKR